MFKSPLLFNQSWRVGTNPIRKKWSLKDCKSCGPDGPIEWPLAYGSAHRLSMGCLGVQPQALCSSFSKVGSQKVVVVGVSNQKWKDEGVIMFSWSLFFRRGSEWLFVCQFTVEKKDRFLPHFGHFSKMPLLNLAYMYESFVTFIMPNHCSDGNFKTILCLHWFSTDV